MRLQVTFKANMCHCETFIWGWVAEKNYIRSCSGAHLASQHRRFPSSIFGSLLSDVTLCFGQSRSISQEWQPASCRVFSFTFSKFPHKHLMLTEYRGGWHIFSGLPPLRNPLGNIDLFFDPSVCHIEVGSTRTVGTWEPLPLFFSKTRAQAALE